MKDLNCEKRENETYRHFWNSRFASYVRSAKIPCKLNAAEVLVSLSSSWLSLFLGSIFENFLYSHKISCNKGTNAIFAVFLSLLFLSWLLAIIIGGKRRLYDDSVLNSNRFSVQALYGAIISACIAIVLSLVGMFNPHFLYVSAAVSLVFIILQAYCFTRTAFGFALALFGAAAIAVLPAYFFYQVCPLASIAVFNGTLVISGLLSALKNI